jgi:hypothetical protein
MNTKETPFDARAFERLARIRDDDATTEARRRPLKKNIAHARAPVTPATTPASTLARENGVAHPPRDRLRPILP